MPRGASALARKVTYRGTLRLGPPRLLATRGSHSTVELAQTQPSAAPQFRLDAIRDELMREHALATASLGLAATPYSDACARWAWLDREMSSNVAGETGAVCIYDGAAFALRLRGGANPATLRFVEEHRAAERSHLELFAELLPEHKHTRLLPLWRVAGFGLGFLPTLISERALFLTVEAVETFVELHYHVQIDPLRAHGRCPQLVALLEHCCADEVHHKEDAAARAGGMGQSLAERTTMLERAWMALVQLGSTVAAEVARRI
jgi:3-demethoxyubiquinol 3-hydroxylase